MKFTLVAVGVMVQIRHAKTKTGLVAENPKKDDYLSRIIPGKEGKKQEF